MATETQVGRRSRIGLLLGTALAALSIGAVLAYADVLEADADVVTAGNQSARSLGTVVPGATLSAAVSFELQCAGNKHADQNQTATIAFHSATVNGIAAAPGQVSATTTTIGPVPAAWPDDSSNCPATPPAPLQDSGNSTVTITAPTVPGVYSVVVKFDPTLAPSGSQDSSSITGSTNVTFTFTVSNPDGDGDGIVDGSDNCPAVANASQTNTDGDGQGDACDADDDGDTVADASDNCPLTANAGQTNTDGDGFGDACDVDDDGDSVLDAADNCPLVANVGQANTDGDGLGNACDADDDNDTVADGADNCPLMANGDQGDNDADGSGDACDVDDDGDSVLDAADNCPLTANAGQTNTDGDGLGDACDADDDNDTVTDETDNCPVVANADQADADTDALGNACDPNAYAPTVSTAAVNALGFEGDTLTASGAFADADAGASLSVTKLSGVGTVTDNGDGTWSWSLSTNDNGSGTVVVQVTDDGGEHSATDEFDWSAANANPVASIAAAPASSPEGTQVDLSGSFTDAGSADTHVQSWSVTKNGAAYASGTSSSFSFTPDDNGSYVVTYAVSDDDGGSGSDSETISVTNVDPTVAVNGAPASSPEGTAVSLTSTVSDPGSADTHTYAWSVTKNGAAYASGTSSSFSFTPDDNGSYVVSLTATDDDGGPGSDSETISVTNVDPTINAFAIAKPAGAACQGATNAVTVSFQVSDPADNTNDPIAGSIDWGDGSAAQSIAGRNVSQTHSFAPGSWTISVSVNDGDGGVANAGGAGSAFSLLYATSGILQPINADKSSNFKLGSTFPIKIRVLDCNAATVGGLTLQVGLRKVASGNGVANEAVVESVPDDGNTMRYDASAAQYIYNLSSKRSYFTSPQYGPLELGTYEVRVTGSLIAQAVGYFDIVK